jgi:diguanylate cyclase
MPGRNLRSGTEIAQKIRKLLAAKKLINRNTNADLGTITVSCGVAQLSESETLTNLIRRADAGLYKAKNAGRDRVVGET